MPQTPTIRKILPYLQTQLPRALELLKEAFLRLELNETTMYKTHIGSAVIQPAESLEIQPTDSSYKKMYTIGPDYQSWSDSMLEVITSQCQMRGYEDHQPYTTNQLNLFCFLLYFFDHLKPVITDAGFPALRSSVMYTNTTIFEADGVMYGRSDPNLGITYGSRAYFLERIADADLSYAVEACCLYHLAPFYTEPMEPAHPVAPWIQLVEDRLTEFPPNKIVIVANDQPVDQKALDDFNLSHLVLDVSGHQFLLATNGIEAVEKYYNNTHQWNFFDLCIVNRTRLLTPDPLLRSIPAYARFDFDCRIEIGTTMSVSGLRFTGVKLTSAFRQATHSETKTVFSWMAACETIAVLGCVFTPN